jgi:hypothetical protein
MCSLPQGGRIKRSDGLRFLVTRLHWLTCNKPAAARVAALLATIYPYETKLQNRAGELTLEAGRPEVAAPLVRRALLNTPGERVSSPKSR